MTSNRRRRSRPRRIGAGTVAVVVVTSAVAEATPAPPFDRMPDGAWLGSLIYNGQVSFVADVQGQANAIGTFDFTISGGMVTEGVMEFSATGLGTASAGSAIATLDIVGAAELSPLPLEIFTVTCELVTGDFVQTIAAAVASADASMDVKRRFVTVCLCRGRW